MLLRTLISMDHDTESNYLITSPTFRLLTQSLLPTFFKYFSGLGTYRAGDSLFRLHDGRTIYIRSLTNPSACEGIPRLRIAWNDECGLLSDRAWNNIETRLAVNNGVAVNTSTPYNVSGWFYQAFQDWKKGLLPDWEFITWKSIDNPYISHEEIEKLKSRLPPTVFRMKYEGSFESPMGLIYNLTSDNYCDPFRLNNNYKIIVGLDFGFSISHTAISVLAYRKDEDRWHAVYEFKRTHLSIGDLIETLRQLKSVYNYESIFCDAAQPQLISEIAQAGLPATECPKGPGSVQAGILTVGSLIQTNKFKIFNNLELTEAEFNAYSWDEKTIGQEPRVIKVNDDLMDAIRYGIMGYGTHYHVPGSDFRPSKTHLERVLAGEFDKRTEKQDWYNQ